MSLAIRAPTIQKPFVRWDTFADCKAEQIQIGHSEESAGAICATIQERAEKGALYKALGNLDILKGEDGDLVVGGHASWEIIDQDTPPDFVTTEAMTNFLSKYFALPEEYRNISIDHHSLIIGKGLLQYPEENPRYFSHVHEKGMYFIAKIRNDKLSYTQHFRQLILDGTYKMFSIRGKATRHEITVMDKRVVRKVFDIDPVEVAIVKEGMNQKAEFQILKGKCPPCIQHLKTTYMSKGFDEATSLDMAEKLFKRVYERLEREGKFKKTKHGECEENYHRNEHGECIRNKTAHPLTHKECMEQARDDPKVEDAEARCASLKKQEDGEKPPKAWWDACVAQVKRGDPAKICGDIFHNVLGGDRSRADPSMFDKTRVSKQFKNEVAHVYGEATRKALPDLKLPKRKLPIVVPSREERLESLNLASEAKRILKKHFPNHERGESNG